MATVDSLAQELYNRDIDVEVLEARLGTLAQEMGGDLSGNSAPRGVSVNSIDIYATARAPISSEALNFGKRVFDKVNADAYKILCTPLGDEETQKVLDEALKANTSKAAGLLAPFLASSLGLSPAIAAIVAALIVKKISGDVSKGICQLWEKSFQSSTS